MFTMSIMSILLLCSVNRVTRSAPVSNGLRFTTVKFYPISVKEDLTSKSYDATFAKIPQGPSLDAKQEILSETNFPHTIELGLGCDNKTAKIKCPFKKCDHDDTEMSEIANSLNLPLLTQPYDEYKILIALAPPVVKIGDKNKPLIIYIVFSEDHKNDLNRINVPSVYFVNKIKDKMDNEEKVRVDPIFIIDGNRTVTGLKSKEISRYITFRNRLINVLNKEFVP